MINHVWIIEVKSPIYDWEPYWVGGIFSTRKDARWARLNYELGSKLYSPDRKYRVRKYICHSESDREWLTFLK